MYSMKHLFLVAGIAIAVMMLTACGQDRRSTPNVEYAPNMYVSIPLEPYTQVEKNGIFKDSLNAQTPPAGTVPRAEGWYREEVYVPYPLPNTPEGYEASATYERPEIFACNDGSLERGKEAYTIFCGVCHGAQGDGKGSLVTSGKFGGVPSYLVPISQGGLLDLPDGKMYHSINWGKNSMGSYASQITPKQRWEVICYIRDLQAKATQQ
jgi:hypothetical protein